MKKIMSKLHFRSIYKTIVLTLILCFVYNIAYLMMSASGMNVYLRQSLGSRIKLIVKFRFLFYLHKDMEETKFLRICNFESVSATRYLYFNCEWNSYKSSECLRK